MKSVPYLYCRLGQELKYSYRMNYKSNFQCIGHRYSRIQLVSNILKTHHQNLPMNYTPRNSNWYNPQQFVYYMSRHPHSLQHCIQNNCYQYNRKQLGSHRTHRLYSLYHQGCQLRSLRHHSRNILYNLHQYILQLLTKDNCHQVRFHLNQ